MTASEPAQSIQTFDDLAQVSDEVLRQVATRVHVVELAYAFATAGDELRDRLLGSVRPGLAEEIRSAMRSVETGDRRYSKDEQVRSARAMVIDVARLVVRTGA